MTTKNTHVSLTKAILHIKEHEWAYAPIVLRLPFIITEDVPIAATDGYAYYVNPQWLEWATHEDIVFVILHEGTHNILNHMNRRGDRDPEVWNWACDIMINTHLAETRPMPSYGIPPDNSKRNMTAEAVYEELIKRDKKSLKEQYGDCDMLMPGDVKGDGRSNDEKEGTLKRAQAQAAKRIIKANPKLAKTLLAGAIPNDQLRRALEIREGFNPDWMRPVHQFMTQGGKRKVIGMNPMRPNRRAYSLPLNPGTPVFNDKVKALWVVDTSGSIDDEILGRFIKAIKDFASEHPTIESWIMGCDSNPSAHYRFDSKASIETIREQIKGGGGTAFSPVWRKIEKTPALHSVKGVIYLTDYICHNFPTKTQLARWPAIWVIWGRNAPPQTMKGEHGLKVGLKVA